jgi:hypothetical protein
LEKELEDLMEAEELYWQKSGGMDIGRGQQHGILPLGG